MPRYTADCDKHDWAYGSCKRCGKTRLQLHSHYFVSALGNDPRYQFCQFPDCNAKQSIAPSVEAEAPLPSRRHSCASWEPTSNPALEYCPDCGQTRLVVRG